MWGVGFALCMRGPGRVWFLFVGVWFWVRGGFVASREIVVGVMSRDCVGFHPRLIRLCGNWGCVRVGVGRCTWSDCGMMPGKKSLIERSFCVVYSLAR